MAKKLIFGNNIKGRRATNSNKLEFLFLRQNFSKTCYRKSIPSFLWKKLIFPEHETLVIPETPNKPQKIPGKFFTDKILENYPKVTFSTRENRVLFSKKFLPIQAVHNP